MELSNRLKAIADLVESNSIIADIGTDHGYIPIYLAQKGIIKHAYAMDINKGPLEKAKKNINKYNLDKIVETRLSNGLEKLSEGEADTIIIAGMGGKLISQILLAYPDVVKASKRLILSPHSDVKEIRIRLHDLGFKIDKELMIKEEVKYYNIIEAIKDIKREQYTAEEYLYGKILIDKKDPLLKEYLQNKKKKLDYLINSLEFKDSENAIKRKKELELEQEIIFEVLECL